MIVTKGRVVMYGGHRYRGMGSKGRVVMYGGHRYRGMGNKGRVVVYGGQGLYLLNVLQTKDTLGPIYMYIMSL